MNRFTLVGGSALALQSGHRQSEDLDFIFDEEKIDAISIKRFIARLFPEYRLIREEAGYLHLFPLIILTKTHGF